MSGALVGFGLSAGLWLIAAGVLRTRRPSVEQRVLPYVRDVHPYVVVPGGSPGVVTAVFGPSVRRAAGVVGEWVGGAAAVRSRLDRLGESTTLEEFRLRQALWGATGLVGAVGLAALLWASQRTAVPALLGICALGFVAGVMWCDRRLTVRVAAREREMEQEFPIVADLLALAVAAGESPVAGLERILRICHGSLADELARVMAEIRTGAPMAATFDALARRTGVTSISRFAEGLAVALERGTPLVDVLHAQAGDVRESARRELMEAGGRKEVSMMLPVVFLVLPVTIVFAFYPGLVGLHLTSGT